MDTSMVIFYGAAKKAASKLGGRKARASESGRYNGATREASLSAGDAVGGDAELAGEFGRAHL